MRVEATLEQWRDLYDEAIKLKELKGWEHINEKGMLEIVLPEYDERFYCNIVNEDEDAKFINIYLGEQAILDYMNIVEFPNMPEEQYPRYNNLLTFHLGEREQLFGEELKRIRKLGYKFRGRGEWIFFRTYKKGFMPYTLNQEEVVCLTLVLKQLYHLIKYYIDNSVKVNFEMGRTLLREFSNEKETWINTEVELEIPQLEAKITVITDELLVARLKKQKMLPNDIELDVACVYMPFDDENFDRPIIPKAFVIADCKTSEIIERVIVSKEEVEKEDIIISKLVAYIMQYGRPKKIYVRDVEMQILLSDLSKKLRIVVEPIGQLPVIDTMLEDILETAYNEFDDEDFYEDEDF